MEMYFKLSELTKLEQQMYYNCIYLFLMEANIQHPEFSAWYSGLFTDDLRLKPEYEIVICEKEYEIAGVTILKSTKEEAKICTVYVAEQYRHNGLGRRLMELSIENMTSHSRDFDNSSATPNSLPDFNSRELDDYRFLNT